MTWHIFLVILHVVGTIFGAGAVTFAGIFYWFKRPLDSISTLDEHFLKTTYLALRIGMLLLVLSGFGFFLEFRLTGRGFILQSPQLWAKMTVVVVILANALLHHWRKLPFLLGNVISAVSWYMAAVLGIVRLQLGYPLWLVIYVAVIVVAYTFAKKFHKPLEARL